MHGAAQHLQAPVHQLGLLGHRYHIWCTDLGVSLRCMRHSSIYGVQSHTKLAPPLLQGCHMLQPAVAAAPVAAAGHPAATGSLQNCRPVRGLFVIARQRKSFQNASGPSLPLLQGLRAVPGGTSGLVGWQVAAKKGHRQHVTLGTVQQVCTIAASSTSS